MQKLATCLIAIMLIISSTGCTVQPDNSSRDTAFYGDLSTPIQINVNQFVRRQEPAVYQKPLQRYSKRPRVLLVPLRMVQQINEPTVFADQVTRQFWQIWLSQGMFQELEYQPSVGPFHPNRALALAKSAGFDMVIGGYINHYFDGGENGDSQVSVNIEAYDVKTGVQIWNIAQGGLMEAKQKHNFYLFSINHRAHPDPANFIFRTLAWDIGHEMLYWINPSATATMKK